MALPIYQVNINVKVNRMRNWLSKPGEMINENLTRCLQRYVLVGYETKRKGLFYTTNNMVLRKLAGRTILIFIEEIKIFTFLFPQKFEHSKSLTPITNLDRSQLMILSRTRKTEKITSSNTLWHVRCIKSAQIFDTREQEIDLSSRAR
jgi:hypothetical protein